MHHLHWKLTTESGAKHAKAWTHADELAYQYVCDLNLPRSVELSENSLTMLSPSLQGKYKRLLSDCKEKHGSDLGRVTAFAVGAMWHSISVYAFFLSELSKIESNFAVEKCLTDPVSHAKHTGYFAGFRYLFDRTNLPPGYFKLQELFNVQCDQHDLTDPLALYFYSEAAKKIEAGDALTAVELVFEASEAHEDGYGRYMWQEASLQTLDELTADQRLQRLANLADKEELDFVWESVLASARKRLGSKGGSARARLYAEIKEWILERWRIEGPTTFNDAGRPFNKSKFERKYIPLVKEKFRTELEERTIQRWLGATSVGVER